MEWTHQIAAAAAVLALLGLTLWTLRRRGIAIGVPGRSGAERRLQALERLALGPQHTLHLVRVESEVLVVACSPSGCALLGRAPARGMGEERR